MNLAGYSCSKFYGILEELKGSAVWIGQGMVIKFMLLIVQLARTLCNPKQFGCKGWDSSSFVLHESLQSGGIELPAFHSTSLFSSRFNVIV